MHFQSGRWFSPVSTLSGAVPTAYDVIFSGHD